MVREAIQCTGSLTDRGPDGISYAHLKHLGPNLTRSLTDIFNLPVRLNVILFLAMINYIIPILKPGKSLTLSSSYRPFSSRCKLSQIIERLVFDSILRFLPL